MKYEVIRKKLRGIMKNVILVFSIIVLLFSCKSISNIDRIRISNQVERYYSIPKLIENLSNNNEDLFKKELISEIETLFASPLKDNWEKWINNGSLGSCYFSNYTNLIENRKIYQDTLKINSDNTIQYLAKMENLYELDSEFNDINFLEFKDQNITNTTYDLMIRKVDYFYENSIPFTLKIMKTEKEILNFINVNNSFLIVSVETECLEIQIEIIKRDD